MTKRAETSIGLEDPINFNRLQYTLHAAEYTADNPDGTRGGRTPIERVARFGCLLEPGRTVFEIGPGPGHDAEVLAKRYKYIGGDVSQPFIDDLSAKGLRAIYFDASTDSIPDGVDGIYAHISLIHIRPRDLARFLTDTRNRLGDGRVFYASFIEGFGHELSKRSGRFRRHFTLYPLERLRQIYDQEGIETRFMDRVEAINGTVTWHTGGVFKQEYEGGSYGEKGLHPFGDVYYSINALYNGNLVHDLVDAQCQAGLLKEEERAFIKAAERTFDLGHINLDELVREVNNAWASGFAGQDVTTLMQQAKEFLEQQPRFRPLTTAALAVCNNNGFSNILVGYEPSWLIKVVAKHLNMETASFTHWKTETGYQSKGKLTGEVRYERDNTDPGIPIIRHQDQLRTWLGPKYKRVTVGVGHSMADTSFLANTDYPIFTYPGAKEIKIAREMGVFTRGDGQRLDVGNIDQWWLRWAAINEPRILIKYLNMITSGRFPIQPTPKCNERRLWTCPDNELNKDFFKVNQLPVHIL